MKDLELKFDRALERVKNGETLSAVILNFPEPERAEISELLMATSLLRSANKIQTPQPLKRKLFLESNPVISGLSAFIRRYNLVPIGLVAAVALITSTTYGATLSLPGDKLFVVKRAVEETRVKLTLNPQSRAALQVELAAHRLEEAQKVLNTKDELSQQLAVKELDEQTTIALDNVKTVASEISNKEIVNKVERIAANKNTLLEKIDPTSAKSSAEKSEIAIKDIKQIIATAEEKSEAKIEVPQNIFINGAISSIKENIIQIDKTEFVYNPQSSKLVDAVSGQETELLYKDISAGDTVQIIAAPDSTKNIITRLTRTAKAPAKQTEIMAPENKNPIEKPKDTFGGFIAEPVVQTPESN